jgi:hypothetical protein
MINHNHIIRAIFFLPSPHFKFWSSVFHFSATEQQSTDSYRAPIGQGYGLTETCAGGTFSEFDDTSVGRVGNPVPCSYIKVSYD